MSSWKLCSWIMQYKHVKMIKTVIMLVTKNLLLTVAHCSGRLWRGATGAEAWHRTCLRHEGLIFRIVPVIIGTLICHPQCHFTVIIVIVIIIVQVLKKMEMVDKDQVVEYEEDVTILMIVMMVMEVMLVMILMLVVTVLTRLPTWELRGTSSWRQTISGWSRCTTAFRSSQIMMWFAWAFFGGIDEDDDNADDDDDDDDDDDPSFEGRGASLLDYGVPTWRRPYDSFNEEGCWTIMYDSIL